MTHRPDRLTQADQMGRPAINTVFNHGNDKSVFNVTQPADQRNLLSTVSPTTSVSVAGVTVTDPTGGGRGGMLPVGDQAGS